MERMDYKKSGVDIDLANKILGNIKDKIKQTFTENVVQDIGKFGGFFQIDENRILVASIDGVGTKVKTAKLGNKLNIVGEDIVNHCVNDIAVHNAQPLFFLDYIASSKLNPNDMEAIISGITKACKENNCALIGGETAEMPGVYNSGMLDIAGVIIGIVDKRNIIDGRDIKKGDVLIGISSNGVHTNGFSLINKLFFENNKYDINQKILELNDTLSNQLLRVHISYYPFIKEITQSVKINGIAHITGGGLYENIIRLIPDTLKIKIDYNAVEVLPIFKFNKKIGNIKTEEMFRVFNMGIGLVVITDKKNFDVIKDKKKKILNKKTKIIGEVI